MTKIIVEQEPPGSTADTVYGTVLGVVGVILGLAVLVLVLNAAFRFFVPKTRDSNDDGKGGGGRSDS